MMGKTLEVLIECTIPYSPGNLLRGSTRPDLLQEDMIPSYYSIRIEVFRHMVAIHPKMAEKVRKDFEEVLMGLHSQQGFNTKDFSERDIMRIFLRDDGAESLRFMALGKALGLWELSQGANGEIRAISRSRSKRKT
jgi:hypothetical protein